MRRLLLSLTLFLSTFVFAETGQMLWVSPDDEGRTHKNIQSMGIKESTFALLAEALPELENRVVSANNIRALQMLEDNPVACTGNKILSRDRAERFYASALPQTVFPGLRLYTREESPLTPQLIALQQAGSLELPQVLDKVQDKRFGVVGGRRYSKQIDAILRDPIWQSKLWTRTASDMGAGMFDMLLTGRIAALLEHPNSAFHYHQQLNSDIGLHSFAVTQAPGRALGYILCSKTPEGKRLSEMLSHTIARLSQTPAYLRAHLDWLPQQKQEKASYLQLYNEVYGTNFQGTLVSKAE
ncbi:hypothetical protein [Lacimicrobium alkaliphilum]|uniref:Solute-binding protein family 3/N-terminal domain-containing protein n=1 Tax=Lacimicrobium alkaliphilum TaxID=1526571 RepID=A0ABQ1RLX7_9ALTE|nr:hypothetical protein [Lacimicrobium alkaliphilum]GGD70790.1 hypothetical protein GCM10011357_27330 [Lacimicrobium alkaliphilum]